MALKRILHLVTLVLAGLCAPSQARADGAASDSVYLIGEFVDPVCIYQHAMQGTLQRQCAMVSGRVEQGMFFLDIRQRKLYTVIGQTHWEDPVAGFHSALGDTFAIRARVWKRMGSAALSVTATVPWRDQPPAEYRWWPWHREWSVLLGCGLWALLYVLALTVWRRTLGGEGLRFERWRALAFFASLLLVIVALTGPLHDLSDLYLFSAHMVQHLILAQLFPLLFAIGIPAWLWRGLLAPRWIGTVWRSATAVPVGFVAYTIVLLLFHLPLFYDLMMRNHNVHIAMHLLLMATAFLMWWPIVGGAWAAKPLTPGAQMLYLFLLGTPMMAVAALVTFAQRPLYEWYALAPRVMAMSAVEDQRLAGLIMWVPGGMFYWLIMSIVYFRWAKTERSASEPLVIGPMPGRTT